MSSTLLSTPSTSPSFFNIILYHKNCFDGICAVWVYRRWLEQNKISLDDTFKFIGMNYSNATIPEECKNSRVLILDYCFSQETTNELCQKAKSVLIIDHHETSKNITLNSSPLPSSTSVSSNGSLIHDIQRSGCQLTFDTFFPGQKRPLIVDYIGNRDIWKWDLLPFEKEITSYIYNFPETLETIETLESQWDTQKYIDFGSILVKARDQDIQKISKNFNKAILSVDDQKYNILVGDCSWMFRSDVGNYVCQKENCDFVLLYTYYFNTQTFSISLRGNDKVDLSEVAKKFGGGGHKNASAFSSQNLDFLTPIRNE